MCKHFFDKTWEAFMNGIFLIHRKSPLLIEATIKLSAHYLLLNGKFPKRERRIMTTPETD